jgi:hypothetical protein
VPTPTSVRTPSADNTVVNGTAAGIIDAAGNVWSITAGGQVAVNGAVDTGTSSVIELAYEKGMVWQENASNLWWSKSAPTDQWGPSAGTAASPVPGSSPIIVPSGGVPSGPTAPGNWIIQTVNGMQYMVLLPAGYDPTVKYATTLYLHQLDNGSNGPQALQDQINPPIPAESMSPATAWVASAPGTC